MSERKAVFTEADWRALTIAVDELEAYVSAVGGEDEAHDRQVWACKRLRALLKRLS